jgi:hypothetical protein
MQPSPPRPSRPSPPLREPGHLRELETRTKSENSNMEKRQTNTGPCLPLSHCSVLDLFRISIFGFRISLRPMNSPHAKPAKPAKVLAPALPLPSRPSRPLREPGHLRELETRTKPENSNMEKRQTNTSPCLPLSHCPILDLLRISIFGFRISLRPTNSPHAKPAKVTDN